MTAPIAVWLPCLLGLLAGVTAPLWMVRVSRPEAVAPEMSAELLEAMREVDALTPACPPIAPPPRAIERRAIEARRKAMRRDPNWLPPEWATATAALPGCGYHHRNGVPCGQALNERRPPPPRPMPTRAPGPGIKAHC